jgi:hypothetical protein
MIAAITAHTPCRLTARVLSPSAAARGIDLEEGMIERVRAVLVTPGGCLLAIRRTSLAGPRTRCCRCDRARCGGEYGQPRRFVDIAPGGSARPEPARQPAGNLHQ